MAYTNSPLATYTNILRHKYNGRSHNIDTISIHCVAGVNASLSAVWNTLNNHGCSCNYCIDSYGKIGLFVDEKDGSWCTSNKANDMRAVTIEVVNSGGAPDWPVSDAALKALINLCADICKRNGIDALRWKGDKSLIGQVDKQNMTVHRWFANKACPGNYLYGKHGYIADEVNKILGGAPAVTPEPEESVVYRVQTGAFRNRSNADDMLTLLRGKGYDGLIVKVGEFFKVQLGAFRVRSNAEGLLDSVRNAGYDAFITTAQGQPYASYGKSVDELAREVIAGKWGAGEDRVARLTAAGYDAKAVQARVNEMF